MYSNKYEKVQTLHKGYNSKVYLIKMYDDSQSENFNPNKPTYAQPLQVMKKYFRKFHQKKNEALNLHDLNEYALTYKLNHPHLLKFNNSFIESLPLKNHLCLTMDLMMPLHVLITDKDFKGFLTLPMIKNIVKQTCLGLRYLHENNIIHRVNQILNKIHNFQKDIKPSNIFIDSEGVVKIGDLGISRKIGSNMTSQVCTKNYRAPELFFGYKDYDYSIDIWSLACTVCELYLQHLLFSGRSEIEILTQITQFLGPMNEQVWPKVTELPMFLEFINQGGPQFANVLKSLPPDAQTIIEQMMQLNPAKRPTIQQVYMVCIKYFSQLLDNPYFNNLEQVNLKELSMIYIHKANTQLMNKKK